ncbi:MAG: tyrosine-type recombinase/integrase [bacterium]
MPLELRKGRNGKLRKTWYGRYEVDGRRFTLNLGVRVAGNPTASLSLREQGNAAFERSRTLAQSKLDSLIEEARRKHDSAHLAERIYEIKTGEQIKSVRLSELSEEWARIPRKRKPNARYAGQCQAILRRFVSYLHEKNPNANEVAHVTRTLARSFLDAEAGRGVAAKTWNDTLKLLRATCKYLLPLGSINPFLGIPTKETETIFRKPFSPEELNAITQAAKNDDFIRPIIVIGMCTAMRRGDCCLLKWKDVDLAKRFITVKTAKTGQTVSIPIFPMLYEEIVKIEKKPSEAYVFPEQARMYLENPDGITLRVQKIFAVAGFKDGDALLGEIHAERKDGLRRASVRDFHSFRVTWVTLALTAGVPLELVQKVTRHRTTDIVLKHYFQPGREEFRRALQSAMPKLLTNGQKSPGEQMRAILEKMTNKTLQHDRKQLLELLASM